VVRAFKSKILLLLARCRSQASKWEVELKSDNSPLTKADTMANAIICRDLQRLSPHVPIISEENKIVPHEVRKVGSVLGVHLS
jgi:3'-phosphoadenosine 5'-phosphosulfate (PAPS) 3'-phosphatase